MSTYILSWSDFVTTTMSEVGGEEDDRTCEVAVVTLIEDGDIKLGSSTLIVVDGDGQDMESEGIYSLPTYDKLRHGVEFRDFTLRGQTAMPSIPSL